MFFVIRNTQNFTPYFAHKLSRYNLHYICNALRNCQYRIKFTVIPSANEIYISLTLKVFIEMQEKFFEKNPMSYRSRNSGHFGVIGFAAEDCSNQNAQKVRKVPPSPRCVLINTPSFSLNLTHTLKNFAC